VAEKALVGKDRADIPAIVDFTLGPQGENDGAGDEKSASHRWETGDSREILRLLNELPIEGQSNRRWTQIHADHQAVPPDLCFSFIFKI
jgi:hypothetical protein